MKKYTKLETHKRQKRKEIKQHEKERLKNGEIK
jgi:hypothetical protein